MGQVGKIWPTICCLVGFCLQIVLLILDELIDFYSPEKIKNPRFSDDFRKVFWWFRGK